MNKKKRKQQKPISLGEIIKEDLPLPYVHYPNLYGTFFGFSNNLDDLPSLCSCNLPAIENYFKLGLHNNIKVNSNPHRMVPLNNRFFPAALPSFSTTKMYNGIKSIKFAAHVCHRCVMSVPSLRYCHEMYGTEFIQNFGWYINQTYLKLGVDRRKLVFLEEICPQELQNHISEYVDTNKKYMEEHTRLIKLAYGPNRDDIDKDEITYWQNVKINEAEYYKKIARENRQKNRNMTKYIENIVRQEFGIKKVGEGWIGETILKQIVTRLFSRNKVLIHYRPDWLEGLELDVYLEDLKLAFEYQGQQHFCPIKAWGGELSFNNTKKRDLKKYAICKKLRIKLIYINYYDPLTEDYIKSKCQDYLDTRSKPNDM